MSGPTPAQQATLSAIARLTGDRGYPPTMRELAEDLGVSLGAAREMLLRLRTKGWVSMDPGRARTVRVIRPQ